MSEHSKLATLCTLLKRCIQNVFLAHSKKEKHVTIWYTTIFLDLNHDFECIVLTAYSFQLIFFSKQIEKDQLNDQELCGPIILRILDGIACDFTLAK